MCRMVNIQYANVLVVDSKVKQKNKKVNSRFNLLVSRDDVFAGSVRGVVEQLKPQEHYITKLKPQEHYIIDV